MNQVSTQSIRELAAERIAAREVKANGEPFYESFIRRHFPAWSASRESARVRAAAYNTYRGGIETRLDRKWGEEKSHISGTMGERRSAADMRNRARQVDRDNPVARMMLTAEVDNVIADGIYPQAQTDNEAFNREAEERFAAWLDTADIRGMLSGGDLQRMFWRMCRRDGDGAIILVDRGGQSKLQLAPGDLIKDPPGKSGAKNFADGVETDDVGRPIRFHFEWESERGLLRRQAVAAQDVIYLAFTDEPLRVRGASCYGTIFTLLDHLDRYIDGVSLAAWMATVFGIVFKQANSQKQFQALGYTTNDAGYQQRAIRVENGMVKYLAPEDEIVQVDAKQPMTQTPDFIRAMIRQIAAAFDMPLEIAARDMSQVNFASARIGLLGFYRACIIKQGTFVGRAMTRIYQWWISRERKRQELGFDGAFVTPFPARFWPHMFQGRGWDYTDPVSEAQADQLQIDMGIKSPQLCAMERGRDWDSIQADIRRARETREAAGITNVLGNFVKPDVDVAVDGPDPELERIKAEADAYGVAVRAGVVTPQTDDEAAFRTKLALPAMSADAKRAWGDDKGVRRPITLTPTPGTEQAGPVIPQQEPDNGEETNE